jgi:hypothetical protein
MGDEFTKEEEAEFELVRLKFEGDVAIADQLFKHINKLPDATKVSMWALVDMSDAMRKFLGINDVAMPSNDALQLENAMNEFSMDTSANASGIQVISDQHQALRAKIAQRDVLNRQLQDAGANAALLRVDFEEFDKALKDELIKHHYSRYRRLGPELRKIVSTQIKLFMRVIDALNAMNELLDTKCKGEDEIAKTATRPQAPRATLRLSKGIKPPVPSRSVSHRPARPQRRTTTNDLDQSPQALVQAQIQTQSSPQLQTQSTQQSLQSPQKSNSLTGLPSPILKEGTAPSFGKGSVIGSGTIPHGHSGASSKPPVPQRSRSEKIIRIPSESYMFTGPTAPTAGSGSAIGATIATSGNTVGGSGSGSDGGGAGIGSRSGSGITVAFGHSSSEERSSVSSGDRWNPKDDSSLDNTGSGSGSGNGSGTNSASGSGINRSNVPPTPAYPRPVGIAPPPSRPVSIQLPTDEPASNGGGSGGDSGGGSGGGSQNSIDALLNAAASALAGAASAQTAASSMKGKSKTLRNKRSPPSPPSPPFEANGHGHSAPTSPTSSGASIQLLSTSEPKATPSVTFALPTITTTPPASSSASSSSPYLSTPSILVTSSTSNPTTTTKSTGNGLSTSSTTSATKVTSDNNTTTSNNSKSVTILDARSEDWHQMSRKAKGTTGVTPSIVSTRLNFFEGK